MSSIRLFAAGAAGCACAFGSAHAQVYGVGQVPSIGQRTSIYGLSADGTTAVGYAETSQGTLPIWWSLSGGLHALATTAGGGQYESVSANGSVFIGGQYLPSGPIVGTSAGTFTPIGSLPGLTGGYGTGISANGQVAVGYSGNYSTVSRAFRWTQAGGFQNLGFLGNGLGQSAMVATDVSGDGNTIIGWSNSNLGSLPWRWTSGGGLAALPVPAGGGGNAYGISSDASTAVGYSANSSTYFATRWDLNAPGGPTMTQLPLLAGTAINIANDASNEGRVIVGVAQNTGETTRATYWTQAGGMQTLAAVLNANGVSTAGWQFIDANSVSDDGYTVAGIGIHNGAREGFVAVIPAPSGAVGLVLAACSLSRRRVRA